MVRTGRKPTVIDVARLAGVSQGTVSNALGNTRFVEPETKARIQAAAEALGYVPNARAQRLRTGKANTIGLFITLPLPASAGSSRIGFAMEIAAMAASLAAEEGLALMLVPPVADIQLVPHFLDVDGAIFIEPFAENRIARELRKRGTPVVTIGVDPSAPDEPHVKIGTFAGSMMLLDHLFDRGSRRIAFIGSSNDHDLQRQSFEAYSTFTSERDLTGMFLNFDERAGPAHAREAIARFLGERDQVDGIIAPYDPMAVAAYMAAQDVGYAVPDDLKIVTRYDSPHVREVGITALDLHLSEVAALAVETLLSLMKGQVVASCAIATLPSLICRNSSAGV